jgi:hypothetical protein
VERQLKTAQHRGNLRPATYFLAILAVMDGQSCAQGALIRRGMGLRSLLLWAPRCATHKPYRPPTPTDPDAARSTGQTP